jgi:hypothetical protein
VSIMGKATNFRLFNIAHGQEFLTARQWLNLRLWIVSSDVILARMTLVAEIALGAVLGALLLVAGAFLLRKVVELVKSIAISPRDAGFILAAIGGALLVFGWVATHH